MMQSIAFLIYELNKCAATLAQQNADEFLDQLAQTKSTFLDPLYKYDLRINISVTLVISNTRVWGI